MKEVILHMGFHKSGSSSIQATCTRNRSILKKKGIHYPVFIFRDKKITNHSIPIYSLFTPSPHTFHINIKWEVDAEEVNREYREQLDEILSNEEKIILSGESISALPEDSLFSLRKYIEERGFRITPVAFVRSPVSYQVSAAQERVKNGSTIVFGENYFPGNKIKKLQSVFSENITFYPFKQVCDHDYGPAGFFLNLIGLAKRDLKKIQYSRTNTSLSDQATRLIAHINDLEPLYIADKKSGGRMLNPNRSYKDTILLEKIGGNKYKPVLSEIQHILEKAAQENDWLKDNLGAEYCDDKMDLEFNRQPYHWDRKQLEQLADALAKCPVSFRNIAVDFICDQALLMETDKSVFLNLLDELKIQLV